MSNKPTSCSRCKKKILNGLSYTYRGQAFCYDCYQEKQKELLAAEDEQQVLYNYIKQLFSVSELPNDVLTGINKEVAKGKKYKGMRLTLHYYYEVMENARGSIDVVPYVIRDQYDNARQYEEEVARVRKINEEIDLSNPPKRTIVITSTDLSNSRQRKKKCDISDL